MFLEVYFVLWMASNRSFMCGAFLQRLVLNCRKLRVCKAMYWTVEDLCVCKGTCWTVEDLCVCKGCCLTASGVCRLTVTVVFWVTSIQVTSIHNTIPSCKLFTVLLQLLKCGRWHKNHFLDCYENNEFGQHKYLLSVWLSEYRVIICLAVWYLKCQWSVAFDRQELIFKYALWCEFMILLYLGFTVITLSIS
jgi:hypothetical protein